MERLSLILATLIAAAQLSETYLRRTALTRRTSAEVKRRLWLGSALWSVASIVLYKSVFDGFGVNAAVYKAMFMLGWLPHFLIESALLSRGFAQHVFLLSMGATLSLFQHSTAATIILLTITVKSDAELILMEAAGYLIISVLFLPIGRRYFAELLPARELFDLRPTGIYIAIMPLVIISGSLIQLADGVLVHSWAERLSRIYLPVVLLFFYHYILSAANSFYALQKLRRNKQRLEEQLGGLKRYNALIRENQRQVSVMRHDLRHSYNLLYALLESGNVAKARELIITQELLLAATDIQTFCHSPMINAALTVSLRHAEEAGVKVFPQIKLPAKLETDELDLALLLSNVLAGATAENIKQAEPARELSIILRHEAEQCVLEISFDAAEPLPLDAEGLPLSLTENHGKDSLQAFMEEYEACAVFSQQDGKAHLLMYWNYTNGGGG